MMFQKRKRKKNEKNKVRDYYEKKEREKMKAKNKVYYIKEIKKSTREWDSEGGNLYTQCKRLGE